LATLGKKLVNEPGVVARLAEIKDGVIYIERPSDVESYINDFSRLASDFAPSQSRTKEPLHEEIERKR